MIVAHCKSHRELRFAGGPDAPSAFARAIRGPGYGEMAHRRHRSSFAASSNYHHERAADSNPQWMINRNEQIGLGTLPATEAGSGAPGTGTIQEINPRALWQTAHRSNTAV